LASRGLFNSLISVWPATVVKAESGKYHPEEEQHPNGSKNGSKQLHAVKGLRCKSMPIVAQRQPPRGGFLPRT
jgi:hypothetical protein